MRSWHLLVVFVLLLLVGRELPYLVLEVLVAAVGATYGWLRRDAAQFGGEQLRQKAYRRLEQTCCPRCGSQLERQIHRAGPWPEPGETETQADPPPALWLCPLPGCRWKADVATSAALDQAAEDLELERQAARFRER